MCDQTVSSRRIPALFTSRSRPLTERATSDSKHQSPLLIHTFGSFYYFGRRRVWVEPLFIFYFGFVLVAAWERVGLLCASLRARCKREGRWSQVRQFITVKSQMKWDPWLGWAGGGIHNAPWGFFFFLSPHSLCSACACVCGTQLTDTQTHRNTQPPSPSVSVCHIANPLYAPQHSAPPSSPTPPTHTWAHTLSGTRPSARYPTQWNDDNLLPRTHRCRRRRRLFPAGFLILIVTLGLTDFFGGGGGVDVNSINLVFSIEAPLFFLWKEVVNWCRRIVWQPTNKSSSTMIHSCVFLSRQLIHFQSQSFPMDPEHPAQETGRLDLFAVLLHKPKTNAQWHGSLRTLQLSSAECSLNKQTARPWSQ